MILSSPLSDVVIRCVYEFYGRLFSIYRVGQWLCCELSEDIKIGFLVFVLLYVEKQVG